MKLVTVPTILSALGATGRFFLLFAAAAVIGTGSRK